MQCANDIETWRRGHLQNLQMHLRKFSCKNWHNMCVRACVITCIFLCVLRVPSAKLQGVADMTHFLYFKFVKPLVPCAMCDTMRGFCMCVSQSFRHLCGGVNVTAVWHSLHAEWSGHNTSPEGVIVFVCNLVCACHKGLLSEWSWLCEKDIDTWRRGRIQIEFEVCLCMPSQV